MAANWYIWNRIIHTEACQTSNRKEDVYQSYFFCTTWKRSIAKYLTVATYPFEIGLIIDAFGELRDQQEQVREDMEVWEEHYSFSFVLLI